MQLMVIQSSIQIDYMEVVYVIYTTYIIQKQLMIILFVFTSFSCV